MSSLVGVAGLAVLVYSVVFAFLFLGVFVSVSGLWVGLLFFMFCTSV